MGSRTVVVLSLVAICVVVQGSSINFDGGSFGVRPGCPLNALGEVELVHPKHEAPCGDQEDQDDWKKTVDMWGAAGNTWVDACTAQKTQPMAKGCPPVKAAWANGKPYEAAANAWVQYYSTVESSATDINKGTWASALMDIRYGKLVWNQSKMDFPNGFLYLTNGGILKLNYTHVYAEDTEDSPLGAGIIGVNAKLGAVASSELVQQDAVFAWKNGKIWLVNTLFKQIGGAAVLQDTNLSADTSQIQFWNCKQAHIARSTLNLTNSVVSLSGSFLHVWDTTLIVSKDTQFNITADSRLLFSNVKILGDGFVSATDGVSENYGVNSGSQVDAMNIDFKIEGKASIVLGPEKPASVSNGRK